MDHAWLESNREGVSWGFLRVGVLQPLFAPFGSEGLDPNRLEGTRVEELGHDGRCSSQPEFHPVDVSGHSLKEAT